MSRADAPLVDDRPLGDTVARVRERAGLQGEQGDPLASALVDVFARYCGIIVERLNRVPEKHHAVFLDLLGVAPRPPAAARALLAFTPSAQLPTAFAPMVPRQTRVATASGDAAPVVFETTRAIELTRARLVRAVAVDPGRDCYEDLSARVLASDAPAGAPAGAVAGAAAGAAAGTAAGAAALGERPLERAFYLAGSDALADGVSQLRVEVSLDRAAAAQPATRPVEWFVPGPDANTTLAVARDTTASLTRGGEIVFDGLPARWPEHRIDGIRARWLGCRLAGRRGPARTEPAGALAPSLAALTLSATRSPPSAGLERAFFDSVPLDTSKDFFPLGERPRFGDVFYASAPAFTVAGAQVVVGLRLTNPASTPGRSPLPAVGRAHEPRLQWEAFVRGQWVRLECIDSTRSLTEDGDLVFSVPEGAAGTTVNGVAGSWIRARLVSGDYAVEAPGAEAPPHASMGATVVAPPAIERVAVSCTLRIGPSRPGYLVWRDGLQYVRGAVGAGGPFEPFGPAGAAPGSLQIGLRAPAAEDLAGRTLDLCIVLDESDPNGPAVGAADADSPQRQAGPARWQYWGAHGWAECAVDDATHGLRTSGIVSLQLGEDACVCRSSALESDLYWLRRMAPEPDGFRPAALGRVALNMVTAEQALTVENELLGSSDGRPSQSFRAARAPLLDAPVLEVREPHVPRGASWERLRAEEGSDAVTLVRDSRGQVQEIWVRWHRVDDLSDSDPHARHFTADALTGRIGFGDAVRGAVPPAGANNIRLRRYRTGGGARGNLPAGALTRLRSAVPYVESVTNPMPASGGRDMEDGESVRRRGSGRIRHRDRAVCADDYEDLVRQAAPEVARAKCFAATRFAPQPFARLDAPGAVSLFVVPRAGEPCPKPSPELLQRVRQALEACLPAGIELQVAAAQYLHVCVDVQIVIAADGPTSDVGSQCDQALRAFLHPVTGGPQGGGWAFGRQPRASELHAVLAAVPGVRFVRSLQVVPQESRPGLLSSGAFLVCSGQHRIRVLR